MISNYFEPNFNVDYSFQYRYRSKAISFYFYKEFACAFAMLVIFQYINYKYLILFSDKNLDKGDSDLTASADTSVTANLLRFLQAAVTTTDPSESEAVIASNIKINNIINSIREYVNWNFLALFFSGALMF
jgi:hypothetical protein